MKNHLFPALEAVAILLVVPLGAVWPSIYTLIAILVLPAFFVAVVWAVKPPIFAPREFHDSRRAFRHYVHFSAIVSVGSVLFQGGWLLVDHSTPVDIIVAQGGPRLVRVVFNVEDGEPSEERDGRRVFRIPPNGVLLTRGAPNSGWWRKDERRFFVFEGGVTQPIGGDVGAAGTTTVGGRCTATYEEYIVEIKPEPPEEGRHPFEDAGSWGLDCREDRLTRRSERSPRILSE